LSTNARPTPEHTPDVFTVPVGPAGGLEAIIAALTRLLAGMDSPTHTGAVFLNPQAHPGRFSQCLVDVEDGAWVECVSNAYLPDHDHLDGEQAQLLVDLGFLAPDDLHPNFWLIHDQPVPWDLIAHLMAAPFATVFPVHELEVMELTVNRRFRERDDDGDPDDDWPKPGPSEVC
jgi:hypothetical protein